MSYFTVFFVTFLSCSWCHAVSHSELETYLGDVGRPNSTIRQTETWKGEKLKVAYEYQLDQWGTRDTKKSNLSEKKEHIVLMGGSNTFGELLHRKETISHLISESRNRLQVYNYSFRGWGPSSLLSLFKFFPVEKEILPKKGKAYFFLYFFHINRVVGSSCFYKWSKGLGPYYAENVKGDIEYRGLFKEQVFRSFLLTFVDRLFQIFNLDRCFPRITEEHAELTVKVLKELELEYRKGLSHREFYVVIPPEELRFANVGKYYDWLLRYAKKHQLKTLEPSFEGERDARESYKHSDGHLNPLGAKLYASSLLELIAE